MRITANQLTVSRIVLMPLPVALVLTEIRWVQLLAWVLYVAIGVTDFFDGILARKYGSTRFGRLTDPIADKIYVALMFLPLALLDLLPVWMTVLVLMRDPLITALRSLSERYGMTMKTATLAKYKTAIQMIAGGYIMFAGIVRERWLALICMGLLAALAWLGYVLLGVKRKNWDPRMLTMGGLMTMGAGIRAVCNVELTLILYGVLIMVVTWISAWNYLIGFFGGLGKATRRPGATWWLLYAVESGIVPLFVLLTCFASHVPVYLPMIICSVELAVGALDNILTSEGHERSARHVAIKLMLQLAIAAVFVLMSAARLPTLVLGVAPAMVLVLVFGTVSLISGVVAFLRYAPRIL